jgi:hypothetical protein
VTAISPATPQNAPSLTGASPLPAGTSVAGLLGMLTIASIAGAAGGAGLRLVAGLGEDDGTAVLKAAIAALCVLVVSAVVVVGAFAAMRFGAIATKAEGSPTVQPPTVQPLMLTAMSVVRMMLSVFAGLAVSFVAKPAGMVFWMCFLIGGMLCLLAETTWSVRVMQALSKTASAVNSAPHSPGNA